MKTIYHFTATLLALITMAACAELEVSENAQSSNNELLQKLSITGKDFKFDGKTRSSVNIGDSGASFTWDEDDVIGIFPDKGDQVSFAMDEGAGTQTATFSGGGWALKSSAKYAAYYPHVYENRDMTKIPVSYVGQAQNGNANTDHIGAYDFMAAGVSTPENGAVAFDMQHLGALVQLTITVPEPSALTKVVLSSSTKFTETGTIDLTADTPAITDVTQSNTLEIALNNVTTTEANEKVIVYFMMAPVDLTDSELTATIHFDDEIIHEVEISGKNFQSGKAYRLAVIIPTYYIDEYGMNRGVGVEIDGTIWAPVNCGYHETDYKYGKLYQWGRKYGQGYNGPLYNAEGVNIGEYLDATVPTIKQELIDAIAGNNESNSNIFFFHPNYQYYDWSNPQDDTLWKPSKLGDAQIKSEYDPCPKGWRVPTSGELEALCENYSSMAMLEEQVGVWFSGETSYSSEVPRIFLPAAGFRDKYGEANARGIACKYWSSSIYSQTSMAFIYLGSDYWGVQTGIGRVEGYSIRCVHE